MSNQLQYLRKINLIVADKNGDGLDLSQFRIVFDVKLSDSQTPNTAKVRVYNLSQTVASQIQQEFTSITLQAGYDSNFGTIFAGSIKQVVYGSENNVDTFIDIRASDGDVAYNYAFVNSTLGGGASQKDIVTASLSPMQQSGIGLGYVDDTDSKKLPRSKVMYGMSRDYLRKSAINTNTNWSIQNGNYQSVKQTGILPNQAVVLNSTSGLVYTPNQTNDGIIAKCLLNPNIKIASSIQINQNDIQAQLIEDQPTSGSTQASSPSPIAADGFYRVLLAEHNGDTRGNDWYTTITGLSMDKTSATNSQVAQNG
ncbi:MAG: hypothetical protein IPP74_14340 [Alphaproteobacteria bacterium]|nr:hypothetical protein [Alphaproteobacteria bacterium]